MSDQGNVSTSTCAPACQASPQLQLYQTVIFAMPVFFALLLLFLFCTLYLRRRRNAYMSSQGRVQFAAREFSPTPGHEYGLSKSFRQRLPTVSFDDKFAAVNQDYQCAVCLSEYQPDEKLQQLPACKHYFHVPCIDEWLAKNITCPICRTCLIEEETAQMGLAERENDHRFWEERVVINDFQETLGPIRADVNVPSSSSTAGTSSETVAPRFSIDHSVDLERS